jgi:hypothetical protein
VNALLAAAVCTALLFVSPPASADESIRRQPIEFKKGATAATVKGSIKGDQIVDYPLRAAAGQTMTVIFKPNNPSAYFNVLPPGSDEALFVGSSSGNRFEASLLADGVYTIRVYLMRNAARRNETAGYTLEMRVTGAPRATGTAAQTAASAASGPFDRTLERQGIRFRVTSANDSSVNTLRIVPAGLEIDNAPIEREIDGTVTGAEVADLNADGSPEIYVYVTSAGSGSYGSLVAYSANRRRSLSEIYLRPVTEDKAAAKGYMGHDQFAVVENALVQRFPIYRDTDTNARPTGGTRQLQYKLVPGEAGWILKLDKRVEY